MITDVNTVNNTNMVERINILLKAKNVSARQFAEEIGIQPSGMSHILSGRNNPSLEFVMKVMKRWPEVNINWLMFGKGEMYVASPINVRDNAVVERTEVEAQEQRDDSYDLFSQPELPVVNEVESPLHDTKDVDKVDPLEPDSMADESQGGEEKGPAQCEAMEKPAVASVRIETGAANRQLHENCVDESVQAPDTKKPILVKRSVERIVVFYSDHTFIEYLPE